MRAGDLGNFLRSLVQACRIKRSFHELPQQDQASECARGFQQVLDASGAGQPKSKSKHLLPWIVEANIPCQVMEGFVHRCTRIRSSIVLAMRSASRATPWIIPDDAEYWKARPATYSPGSWATTPRY